MIDTKEVQPKQKRIWCALNFLCCSGSTGVVTHSSVTFAQQSTVDKKRKELGLTKKGTKKIRSHHYITDKSGHPTINIL